MRYGGETEPTLKAVHARVKLIEDRHLLPPGMRIVPYYDRGDLVRVTTHTVLENLLLGMGLVTVVLLLFLGHARAALITAINIPMALMIAFCGLVGTGTSANLISLGAVDFAKRFFASLGDRIEVAQLAPPVEPRPNSIDDGPISTSTSSRAKVSR